MDILILGGTRFLGRHLVNAAQERGHNVTLFNRGKSNPGLFDNVEELHGDRDGALEALEGRRWDAVIDTCGYVPRIVRQSARLLAGAATHYTFISTISVYDSFTEQNMSEEGPLGSLEDPAVEEITGETYGPLKVLCEREAQEALPDGALIIRPGLIVGPHDPTDRFTYWPLRVAAGGEVLAPGEAARPIQIIDVRDLAGWTITLVEQGVTGIFNATGPAETLRMGEVLETSRRVSDSLARFTWVDEAFLLEHGVQPFVEIPLWVPGEEGLGIGTINIDKAVQAGLRFRPLEETVSDTLQWAAERPEDYDLRAGLDPEKEAELLRAWHKRQAADNADDDNLDQYDYGGE